LPEFPSDRRHVPPGPDGVPGNLRRVERGGADNLQRQAFPGDLPLDNRQILPEGMMYPPSSPPSRSSSPPPPDPFPTAHDELGRAPQQQIFRVPPWEEQQPPPVARRLQRDMIDGRMEPWTRYPGLASSRPAASLPGPSSLPAASGANAPSRPPASSSQQDANSSMPAAAGPEEARAAGRVRDPLAHDQGSQVLEGMIDDLLLD